MSWKMQENIGKTSNILVILKILDTSGENRWSDHFRGVVRGGGSPPPRVSLNKFYQPYSGSGDLRGPEIVNPIGLPQSCCAPGAPPPSDGLRAERLAVARAGEHPAAHVWGQASVPSPTE